MAQIVRGYSYRTPTRKPERWGTDALPGLAPLGGACLQSSQIIARASATKDRKDEKDFSHLRVILSEAFDPVEGPRDEERLLVGGQSTGWRVAAHAGFWLI